MTPLSVSPSISPVKGEVNRWRVLNGEVVQIFLLFQKKNWAAVFLLFKINNFIKTKQPNSAPGVDMSMKENSLVCFVFWLMYTPFVEEWVTLRSSVYSNMVSR